MRESILSYSDGLQYASVSQLLQYFIVVKQFRRARFVGFETADKLRRARHHLLQQVHEGVAKIRGHGLLGAGLRGETATIIALLENIKICAYYK